MAKVAKRPRRVWMWGDWYKVLTSPDRLQDKRGRYCRVLRDDEDHILWTDPNLEARDRERAIVGAVLRAYEEAGDQGLPA